MTYISSCFKLDMGMLVRKLKEWEIKGYDIKITRTGKGQFDTTYSVMNCKPTQLDKKYTKPVELEKMVRAQIKSYDELEEILKSYLNESSEEEDEDEPRPKKKKSSLSSDKAVSKKKKKKATDI